MQIRPYLYRAILLPLVALLAACATNMPEHQINQLFALVKHAEPVLTKPEKILVVSSNRAIDRYAIAESAFLDSFSEEDLYVVDLQGKLKPVDYVQDALNAQQFDLIYAIGAKALGSINVIAPNTPVVYSAVLNWRRFLDHKNYYGISSELSPQVQLTWFKLFFPEIKKIAVFYSKENKALIEDAHKVAANLSITLNAQEVKNQAQLEKLSNKVLDAADAMWLISDSEILSSVDAINRVFALAERKQVPVLTYNPVFVELGAVLSLAADLPTTGRQAGLVASELLDKRNTSPSIQYPAGSRIMLNLNKVREYGLELNSAALDSVDDIYP